MGYWDFPLDELEAFWLKYSWLCKICRKAESQILLSSNPNLMLYIKIDHAAAAVVVCRLSLYDDVVQVVAASPKSPAREGGLFTSCPLLFLLKPTPSTGVGATEYSTLKVLLLVL